MDIPTDDVKFPATIGTVTQVDQSERYECSVELTVPVHYRHNVKQPKRTVRAIPIRELLFTQHLTERAKH